MTEPTTVKIAVSPEARFLMLSGLFSGERSNLAYLDRRIKRATSAQSIRDIRAALAEYALQAESLSKTARALSALLPEA